VLGLAGGAELGAEGVLLCDVVEVVLAWPDEIAFCLLRRLGLGVLVLRLGHGMDDGFRTGVSAVQFEWFLPPFFYSLVVFHLLHWVIWGFGVLEITVFRR